MKNILKKFKHKLRIFINSIYFYNDYLKAFFVYQKNKKSYKNIEKFCFFIGYPRSGHSVVGSILDAHKNIITANDLFTNLNTFKSFQLFFGQMTVNL